MDRLHSETWSYRERAPIYDVECANSRDHAFLDGLLREPRVTCCLEVPAGVGRNLAVYGAVGKPTWVVDVEPAMVDQLRKRIRALCPQAPITALCADMRTLALSARFDLILVPQEGLQVLPTARDAIAAMRTLGSHLTTQGRLIIDLATFTRAAWADPTLQPDYFDPSQPDGRTLHDWSVTLSDGTKLCRAHRQAMEPRALTITYMYAIHATDGITRHAETVVRLARYTRADLLRMSGACGLHPEALYCDYGRRPWRAGAPRMILVLTRLCPSG